VDIRLNWLRQKHFKGIKEFTLQANGKNCSVIGDNGTGKTTQFDSDQWLKFGKDSTDRSQFKVKPQDADGNDIHNLETEVEAEYLVDGKPIKLRKMQEEKWTKKHGAETESLTGNTLLYWWNEVPAKEGEYSQKIKELIDENIFRMITNCMYFNTRVSWQDRRKILMDICGDMSDAEVIASDVKLTKLTGILSDHSIEDYKKILAEKIKGLKEEKEKLPGRIDENHRTLPQVEPDYSEVEKELQGYKDQMTGIELEMNNASNIANAFRKKQQELYGLKGKQDVAKTRIDNAANSGSKDLVDEKSKLNGEKYKLEADISGYKTRIDQNKKTIENNSVERQKLLNEWKSLNDSKAKTIASEFVEPDENSFACPTCGQSLPGDVVEGKLDDTRRKFNDNKAQLLSTIDKGLESNKASGIALKSSTETLQKAIEGYTSKLSQSETRLNEINNRIADIEIVLSEPTATPIYSDDSEYALVQEQIINMQTELDKPVEDTTSSLLQNKREAQTKIDTCNKTLNGKDTIEKTKKRIEELKAEEKRVAALITEFEGHKYLLDQFVITKVNLMDSNINSRFKYVRFKMFNLQVNGGIDECCEAMVDGVPIADVNHGKKINAGLDIINTLCAYYGVTAPIFVDFSESVSEFIETSSQIIRLVKPETFVKLDKILQEALIKEHGSYEAAKTFWNNRNKSLRVEVEQ
jgi:DNA repair exonuclease SbcCD ATPase subunit